MDYLKKLLETFDPEDYTEIIFGLFKGKITADCDLGACLKSLDDSEIEYGWFNGSDTFISLLMQDHSGWGQVSGKGDYYIADDNLNFEFFETPKDLIDELNNREYELSNKEIKKILQDLK